MKTMHVETEGVLNETSYAPLPSDRGGLRTEKRLARDPSVRRSIT